MLAVPGDLARPKLGLAPILFDRLAEEADAIVHCGAMVNFIHPYEVFKAPNVLDGGRAAPRRPASAKATALHLDRGCVLLGAGFRHHPRRRDPDGFEASTSAGQQEQWVAEQMILLARAQGLPIAIYRSNT